MDLKTLVETGKKIIDGIKYVPSEPGVWRTYSVYKVEDRMAYSQEMMMFSSKALKYRLSNFPVYITKYRGLSHKFSQ